MTRSLSGRLLALVFGTLVVALVAFGVLAQVVTRQLLSQRHEQFVRETAERLARSFDSDIAEEADTLDAVRSALEDGADVGVRVEVRDPVRGVLGSSLAGARPHEPAADAPTEPPRATTAVATSPAGIRITAEAVDAASLAVRPALLRAMWIAGVPILLLGLIATRLALVRGLRPLSQMAERAAGLSAEAHPRSLGSRTGIAEIDHLTGSFDRLLERLDDAMRSERRLTADASHELRTPLTVLGGELELLAERSGSNEPGLRRAIEQVGAMRELVEAVLLLHRSGESAQAGRAAWETVNLSDLARETVAEALERESGRTADVSIEAPDEVLVEGHPALLGSAARNLIDNALKFTRAGQRIEVVVRESDGAAWLQVDDAGPGFPAGDRERIFDAFWRGGVARAEKSGFGLGLPILRRVARAHGGEAEAGDSLLGGARVALRLPRLGTSDGGPGAGPAA